jgi:hypothetical protein
VRRGMWLVWAGSQYTPVLAADKGVDFAAVDPIIVGLDIVAAADGLIERGGQAGLLHRVSDSLRLRPRQLMES